VSCAAKAWPIETNDFHSSLIGCAVTSTFSLSIRCASRSEPGVEHSIPPRLRRTAATAYPYINVHIFLLALKCRPRRNSPGGRPFQFLPKDTEAYGELDTECPATAAPRTRSIAALSRHQAPLPANFLDAYAKLAFASYMTARRSSPRPIW
jgi:hypothetical protein